LITFSTTALSMNVNPKISIITVVRNGEKHIEETIESVLAQTYTNLEYIVIDGKSSDSTVQIVKKYADKIAYWVSESDAGIYDAMNKGVKASTGDWILFINADDFLAGHRVIEEAVAHLKNCKSMVAYGNVTFIYASGEEIKHGVEWSDIRYAFRNIGMRLPHQGTFHSKMLFHGKLFDSNFRITGDYNLLLSYLKDHEAVHFPVSVAKMRAGGISDSVSKIKLLKETRRAHLNNNIHTNFPSLPFLIYGLKLITVDFFIRIFGSDRKDKFKKLIGKQ
jgi:glycosyltransferase involved in cell wall biosynthesis